MLLSCLGHYDVWSGAHKVFQLLTQSVVIMNDIQKKVPLPHVGLRHLYLHLANLLGISCRNQKLVNKKDGKAVPSPVQNPRVKRVDPSYTRNSALYFTFIEKNGLKYGANTHYLIQTYAAMAKTIPFRIP